MRRINNTAMHAVRRAALNSAGMRPCAQPAAAAAPLALPRAFSSHQPAHSQSHSAAAHSAIAPDAPVEPVQLHALDFPFLKHAAAPSLDSAAAASSAAFHPPASSTPLVILHGLLGSGVNWRSLVPLLASDRRTLSVDVRNHGSSPHAEDMRFATCAADVIALLDRKGIDRCVLMGHSLGGKIAMATALLYPDRISALVGVDMAPVDYSLADPGWTGVRSIVDAAASVPIDRMQSRTEVEHFLRPLIPDFTMRGFVMQNVVVHAAEGPNGERRQHAAWKCNLPVLQRALPLIAKFDLSPSVPPAPGVYTQPSLFVGGGLSPYLTPKQYDALRRLFPRAEIQTLHDAGHWLHVEKPKEFTAIAKKFLSTLP